MLHKVLVANRGEIACRVMRTARRLGMATVAVYSDADAGAQHVLQADEAYRIGPAAAADSYLDGEHVIAAARRAGADAIHPGYGFLSENAEFAEACEAAGLVFIGPPAAAIRAMGNKAQAKRLMLAAGVPVVPGYHELRQEPEWLEQQAAQIGFPVLIKAASGGGGKGMRIVDSPAAFRAALESACREARAAFGDDRVILEKYLVNPRHVEVQVFADQAGRCVHLFERDCSLQRRYQKVLEEAPAPGLDDSLRARMGECALQAAAAIDYRGAGTVEFILAADGGFYFMEMNTRLQVEHPVTEMVTGVDLVAWQLRVAGGEALPMDQEDLRLRGHAIEARIYAEDPVNDFLPSTGRLRRLRFPDPEEPRLRIDSGVVEGDVISVYYDPMIAKLVCWGEDRDTALRRLTAALRETLVVGVSTNVEFLQAVATHPAYRAAQLDTGFIERHADELSPRGSGADADRALALASLAMLLDRQQAALAQAARSDEPDSPWHVADGWRLNLDDVQVIELEQAGTRLVVPAHRRDDVFVLELPAGPVEAGGKLADGELAATIDGERVRCEVVDSDTSLSVHMNGRLYHYAYADAAHAGHDDEQRDGTLTAPMPGRLIATPVKNGDRVVQGAPLLVLEAMKMEHTLTAPHDGEVSQFQLSAGDLVEEGAVLMVVTPPSDVPASP